MGWPITPGLLRSRVGRPPFQPSRDEVDDPYRQYTEGAMHRIEEVVGKRRGQLVTQRVPTDTSAIGLVEPLAELVSVTSGASALDLATFSLDDDEAPAVLYGRFPAGSVVTYRCPDTVPADVELATMHLAVTWFRQDNVGPPGQRASGSDGDVLQGFAMPRRVSEMIRPYARTGFA